MSMSSKRALVNAFGFQRVEQFARLPTASLGAAANVAHRRLALDRGVDS
jgi:hypothetical protein